MFLHISRGAANVGPFLCLIISVAGGIDWRVLISPLLPYKLNEVINSVCYSSELYLHPRPLKGVLWGRSFEPNYPKIKKAGV